MTSSPERETRTVLSSPDGEDREAAEAATRAVLQALELARGKGLLPSPTELRLDAAKPCTSLPPLRWHRWDNQAYKMRLTNTGCTVMVSAKWRSKVRPHLTGGPLLGRYVFSQLHFHWGQDDSEGSEHTLQGDSFPLEMHMVLFKSRYLTQEAALKEMDGVVEVAYFFQLGKKDNPMLEPLVQALSKVTCAMRSTRFGPLSLSELVPAFGSDYLMYMGSLLTGKCAHALTWIVRHQPLTISKRQMEAVRSLQGLDGNPLLRNWRQAYPPMGRTVLHVISPGSVAGHKSTLIREEVPADKKQTQFSPDWAESDPSAPPDGSKGRSLFGSFGKKKNQDAAEEKPSLLSIGSSGDSETTDSSSHQPWLPRITNQRSQCHPEVYDSMFRAMCEAGHIMLTSSSSQHSSTTVEDVHDSRKETAASGGTERRRGLRNAAKHKTLDMGVMLFEPPELRKGLGFALLKPPEQRRSVGVTFLDQREHRRGFTRPFNPLLSEVEEESDRTSESLINSTASGGGCAIIAPETSGLSVRALPPLKSPSSVVEDNNGASSMKAADFEAGGIGDADLSAVISTCSLTVPVSSSDSLIFDPSCTIGECTQTSLLTAKNDDSVGSAESDGRKLSSSDERDRNVPAGGCKVTKTAENSSLAIPKLHRCLKGGLTWWVPFINSHEITSDDNGNDANVTTRDVAQPCPIDKFPLTADTIAANCVGEIGEEFFTDTSTTTDTPQTAIRGGQRCTDLLSDYTVNLSSKEATSQQSSEEQEDAAIIRRLEIPSSGFNCMKNNIGSSSLSQYKETRSKNSHSSLRRERHSNNLFPNVAKNVSIYQEEIHKRDDSNIPNYWSTRIRTQKRFDEEELRFPEIRIPKRDSHKPKVQKKRTCLSLTTLQDLQDNNASHSVFQRTTKDGKAKDRINSWRETQSRKRSSRKIDNMKHNRSKRRHHSSSSMDHLLHDSSSEDRSTMEKKASSKFKGAPTTKTNDAVYATGKSAKDACECWRKNRSNSSSSLSSILSSSGAKRIDKVVDTGVIQELIGSDNEMQLQEISLHYVPCRAEAATLNKQHLITTAAHGDSANSKSPSKLRLHLKPQVDMTDFLKKAPSGSYVTTDNLGACVQERELTVGMVLVEKGKCEDGRETNSSPLETSRAKSPQKDKGKLESTRIDDSKQLSTPSTAQQSCSDEFISAIQLESAKDNLEAHQVETSEATTCNADHSHCRNRCCNAECWICQLSTIKVIQFTKGIDSPRGLTTSETGESIVECTPNSMKRARNEDEIVPPANVPSNSGKRSSLLYSRKPGTVQGPVPHERVPLPEPVPVGDVPLRENHRGGVPLTSTRNVVTVLESNVAASTNPKLYRTTVELQVSANGTILAGNSNSSPSAGETISTYTETRKEVVSEEQRAPPIAINARNFSSRGKVTKTVPSATVYNEGQGQDDVGKSTEIIDIYHKMKRRPQRKSKLSLEGVHESCTVEDLSSYASCVTDSDVSLTAYEDEALAESTITQSLALGEDIQTIQNNGSKCAVTSVEDRRNFPSNKDEKPPLKSFRVDYDILSKVMLYATLQHLAMSSRSVEKAAAGQRYPEKGKCSSNESKGIGDAVQPSLDMEVARSLTKVPHSKYDDTSTKCTRTGPEERNAKSKLPASDQAQLNTPTTSESRRQTQSTEGRELSVPGVEVGNIQTNCSDKQLLTVTSKADEDTSPLCNMDDKSIEVIEEKMCNDTDGESVEGSQDLQDLEEFDFSSTSVSTNATKCQAKTETYKPASIQGSVKDQKLCSVEVRNKVPQPGGQDQQRRRPKSARKPDRILSAREVHERRKMYARNLALRRARRASHLAVSEDGETCSNFGENRSVSEGKSTAGSSLVGCPVKNTKIVDGHQHLVKVVAVEPGNKRLSEGKETKDMIFRDTADKNHRDKKTRVATRAFENLKAGKGESSCSTCSTKNNSASSSAKDRTGIDSGSFRNDGVRGRSTRPCVVGHRRCDLLKELDKANASTGRSSVSSEHSGGASGGRHSPGTDAGNVSNGKKPEGIPDGEGLKNDSTNDAAIRALTSRNQRCLKEKQSKKSFERKTSPLKPVPFDCIEVLDKPSLCESWVKQHYSDVTIGSSSIETTVQTIISATKKSDTDLKVPGNPVTNAEKTGIVNESFKGHNEKETRGPECDTPTLPDQQPLLPSRNRKGSRSAKGEQIFPSVESGTLVLPFRTDTVSVLTDTPQKISSDGLKTAQSGHDRESCSVKPTPPTVDSLRAEATDLPSNQKSVDGKGKEAKRLSGKFDENTQRCSSARNVKESTGKHSEPRELRKESPQGNTTPITQSGQAAKLDRKSVATSPMPLRKQNMNFQDGQEMNLTVETFTYCSTGVNTSLSVTRLSSRSLGVQCPSQAASERPSATTDLFQSVIGAQMEPHTQVYAATVMQSMLTDVAMKLEDNMVVQKSVATQWLRRGSVPNVALKSPNNNEKATGKRKKRGSTHRLSVSPSKPPLPEHDLGLNELQMEMVRALHRRRLFRAFSTNSLALGTNEDATRKVMRRLFRRKKKKVKVEGTEGKQKSGKQKQKEEQPSESAAAIRSPGSGESTHRGGDTPEAASERSYRSSPCHSGRLSDGGSRKSRHHKLRQGDQKEASPRLLLVRGAETAQSPAFFEDMEGEQPAGPRGPSWCSAGQAGTQGDVAEVSAAVAQVKSGAHVLRVSLADEDCAGCADVGSMELVVGGSEGVRQPAYTPSVLARLRQMLTWRS